jgi:hypothetical protein
MGSCFLILGRLATQADVSDAQGVDGMADASERDL